MCNAQHIPGHLFCNVRKMKNPTFITFLVKGENYGTAEAFYAGTVAYCKESLIPTYILELRHEEIDQIAEKFKIEPKFPCVCLWMDGNMVLQYTGSNPNYINLTLVWYMMRDAVKYYAEKDNNVRAWRLIKLYEHLKKLKEEGGSDDGRNRRQTAVGVMPSSMPEA